jgi:hypothetical protein
MRIDPIQWLTLALVIRSACTLTSSAPPLCSPLSGINELET